MDNEAIIKTAVKYVQSIPSDIEVRRAFLFGSYARGVEKSDSDIDIAIVVGNINDFFDLQMKLMRLRRKIDLRIEPHPIEESDFSSLNPFANEVKETGIELFLT